MAIDILDELKTDFLVYAQEVNNNRAFPDARDGLKISQRAVLWEMYDRGYFSNKPHIKSAKVDGGVIANWHPHGSEYPTIVRMSQNWINNLSEIDWHGANGSLIGGPDAAASRYTECRLSKIAEDGFFSGIKKDVVPFVKNYSEDLTWPAVFPAIFPRLVVNGSQGIGYTIAQEWEPTNLDEFAKKVHQKLETGSVACDGIFPDYPTGGVIVNKSEIHSIYETGKGSVILRGKVSIEGDKIKITELPYQTYAEPFIQEIKDLVNSEELSGIEDICNKSDDHGLLIEIECSSSPNAVLSTLYKKTDLQTTLSANQMALVDGEPKLLNLSDYIDVYSQHNLSCITAEYEYDKKQAEARLEIVEGLLRALANIDDIIHTIKASASSDDAKAALMSKFSFTASQAKAIVDMKLGRLANLEQVELNNEAAELKKTIDSCLKMLSSKKALQKEFLKRLDAFVQKHGWKRRTSLMDVDFTEEKKAIRAESSDPKFAIALTEDHYLKRVSCEAYKKSDADVASIDVTIKERFILIDSAGMMYKTYAKDIPLCSSKAQGSSWNGKDIIAIFRGDELGESLFMLTSHGLAKKISAKEVFSLSKCVGTTIMKVADGDVILTCDLVDSAEYKLISGSKQKKICTDDFLSKGRGAGGVVAMKLVKGSLVKSQRIKQ